MNKITINFTDNGFTDKDINGLNEDLHAVFEERGFVIKSKHLEIRGCVKTQDDPNR